MSSYQITPPEKSHTKRGGKRRFYIVLSYTVISLVFHSKGKNHISFSPTVARSWLKNGNTVKCGKK